MLKTGKAKRVVFSVADIYIKNHIPRAAAGLSYSLTMAIFPLLICLYSAVGRLFPTIGNIREVLDVMLPYETVNTIMDYLAYVSDNISRTMSVAALLVMLTSSSAAFRLIDNVTGEMRGRRRYGDVFALVFSFLFSILFLLTILVCMAVIVTGKWFLEFVASHIDFLNISSAWNWARFLLMAGLLFVVLSILFRFTAPRDGRVHVLPGALASALALLIVSPVFSYFIGLSVKYPLVYGSLASIILMMFWFYICGIILLTGNALNVALERAGDHAAHERV